MADVEFMESFQEDTTTALEEVMRLVQALETAQARVEEADEELTKRKALERQLREVTIPQYMAQHRLSELKLDNGRRVSITEELALSVPKDEDKKKRIVAFLMANEGGDLVKDEITFNDADEEILAALSEKGITFERTVGFNTTSLKAWIKRALGLTKNTLARIEKNALPEELNVYLYKNTKISKGE